MESVCLEGAEIRKATSLAYTWLQDTKQPAMDRFREHWNRELNVELSEQQWQRACILAHKCSLSTRMQETGYKLLTQWYATPTKLHKWYPQSSELCWRCKKAKRHSFPHMVAIF